MENNQVVPPIIPQPIQQGVPVQPAVPPVQAPQIPVQKKNPLDTLKNKFNGLSKNNKMIVAVIAILFAIIFILMLLVAIFGKRQVAPKATPSPTPISVTPAPDVLLNASKYATDSGVLKIESDLNNIQSQLQTTDIKQTDLNLPNLDYNITFSQ